MQKDFLSKVKRARVYKNLTQEDIAKYLGISRRAYISFEKGDNNFRTEKRLKKLCEYLEIEVPEEKEETYISEIEVLKMDLAIIKKMVVEMERAIDALEET